MKIVSRRQIINQIKNFKKNNIKKNLSKWDRGQLIVLGGREGCWGAPIMAATSGLRVGSGYSYILSSNKKVLEVSVVHPFLLSQQIKNLKAFQKYFLQNQMQNHNCAYVLGPGFGRVKLLNEILQFMISETSSKKPSNVSKVVIDADGLYALSQWSKSRIKISSQRSQLKLNPNWILTPHEVEMARLIHKPVEYVRENRERAIKEAYQIFGCHILLKGHSSLLLNSSQPDTIFQVRVGNCALAKAGTGDVLAGMIGGLLAQNYKPFEALSIAVFWHGDLSDWYIKTKGTIISLLPTDIIDFLPEYLHLQSSL